MSAQTALRIVPVDDAPVEGSTHAPQPGGEPLYWDRTPRLARTALSDAEFKLLGAVEGCCRQGERTCSPSDPELASECGWSVRKTQLALAELRRKGWVRREGSTNRRILVLAYDLAGRPQEGSRGEPRALASARTCACKRKNVRSQAQERALPLFANLDAVREIESALERREKKERPSHAHANAHACEHDGRTDGGAIALEEQNPEIAVAVAKTPARPEEPGDLDTERQDKRDALDEPPVSEPTDIERADWQRWASGNDPILRTMGRKLLAGVPEAPPEPVRTGPALSQGNPINHRKPRRKASDPAPPPPDPARMAIRRAFATGDHVDVAKRVAAYVGEPENDLTRDMVRRSLGALDSEQLDKLLAGSRDPTIRSPARWLAWKLKRIRAPT
jgi:hypothetical protein